MPFIPGNSASLSLSFPDCQQEGIFVRSDNIDENEKTDISHFCLQLSSLKKLSTVIFVEIFVYLIEFTFCEDKE